MGNRYAAVNPQSVQILFQCLGAQAASDASVYRELQRQAAGLGADAVLVISSQPAIQGGFATYDAWIGTDLPLVLLSSDLSLAGSP